MEIVIIGAGSVGMLVASFLSETNHQVKLIVRREEQASQLQKLGLVRKKLDGSSVNTKIQVSSNLSNISKDSIIIIAVKYEQLKGIYEILNTLHPDTPLLFLQNGLAHLDEATKLQQHTIYFGSCQFGAERENDFTVIHRGQGVLKIALERGSRELLQFFSEIQSDEFSVTFEKNTEEMLFEKALLNCLVNPLTAILKVKNGELVENLHTYKILENLYNELMEVFPEQKAQLQFEDVKNLCLKTARNTSSMLGDILHQRPTEIETIVGEVLKRAEKRGKRIPTLNTLYMLVLAIEESGEKM